MSHVSHVIGVARNEDYAFRAPSPPHIYIPQAPDEYDVLIPPFCGIWCENEQFLKFIQEIIQKSSHSISNQEWKYEWRRQAQQILPFLYLGPSSAARDIDFLKRENMTMLLVIRDSAIARAKLLDGAKIARQLDIKSRTIDVSGLTGLIAAFPHAIQVINDHLISIFQESSSTKIGKVLVFCESGNERSAAVVSAYLMATCGLDLISSIHRIQSRRFCISLDDSLKNLLLNYMDILNAKKDVSSVKSRIPNSIRNLMSGKKRRRNEDTDEEGTAAMEICSDEERFLGRTDLAPFR
ncbi:putative tyrosine protein phosphatase 4 [Erysiphe necator]|uniref:Putative tyrosine protein phosphatase 4 n=1 Tax=Uncinula necator TaxID=52586 RepID=A0A0B1PCC1_UNCNE|nr:putative tyrosine protein phosphatase 4 [Erysiphe necator]